MRLQLFDKYSKLLEFASDVEIKHFARATNIVTTDDGEEIALAVVNNDSDVNKLRGSKYDSIRPGTFLDEFPELWKLLK